MNQKAGIKTALSTAKTEKIDKAARRHAINNFLQLTGHIISDQSFLKL